MSKNNLFKGRTNYAEKIFRKPILFVLLANKFIDNE